MRVLWLLPVLAGGLGGCQPGRLIRPGDPGVSLHPSVRWARTCGRQIGSFVLLLLPIEVDNYISESALGDGYLTIREEGNTSEASIGWWHPTYAISLDDGRLLIGRRWGETPTMAAKSRPGDPVGLEVDLSDGWTIVGEGHACPVLVSPDGWRIAVNELIGKPELFVRLWGVYEQGDMILLVTTKHVICLDRVKLRQRAAAASAKASGAASGK